MSNKNKLSPLAIALGTTFTISLSAGPILNVVDNPFTVTQLSNGYMVADNVEGKCGEGKCGNNTDKKESSDDMEEGEGSSDDMKEGEGKCGDN